MTSRDFVYWLQGYFELLDVSAGDFVRNRPRLSAPEHARR